MATFVLCRWVPRLRCLPGLKRCAISGSIQAQNLHEKPEDDSEEKKGMKGVLQHQDGSSQRGYRLHYSSSSYPHSLLNVETTRSQSDNEEDEPCLSTLAPSFWQQSNQNSVSRSRHLSSTKNTRLDLAVKKSPEPEIQSLSQCHREPTPPDVKVDPRAFLKCRAEYSSISVDLNQQPSPIKWKKARELLQQVIVLKGIMKPSDAFGFLLELSRLPTHKMLLLKNDRRFHMLLQYSVENLHLFTLFQLLDVLQAFVRFNMRSAHTVLDQFELELNHRASQMNLHQLLLAADLWCCIGKPVPQFLTHLFKYVQLNSGQVGTPELVQVVYIIGEGRHCPKELIHPLEQLLFHHLKHLLPEEVGTVCLGIFKSQTLLSQAAVTCIADKASSVVEEMSDFGVVNMMKLLRFSHIFHWSWIQAMAREVPRRVPGMGVKGLMHMALAFSALHCRDEIIFTAIASRVPSMVRYCRSKDSCKLLWTFGNLGFPPVQFPDLYPSLTEGLRWRKAEFRRYPEHLLTGLLGLAFVSKFPVDLLEFALSPEFVKCALKPGRLDLRKDLYTLDRCVALELPQWNGPNLSSELKQEVEESLWIVAQSDVCQKREVQDAESALKELLGGENFVCKRMILPHTRSIDLEIHLDAAGQPIPVSQTLCTETLSPVNTQMYIGVSLNDKLLLQLTNAKKEKEAVTLDQPIFYHGVQPDDSDEQFDTSVVLTSGFTCIPVKPSSQNVAPQDSKCIEKLAVQVCNKNHYCFQSPQLLGIHALKRRHLKLVGYRIVELDHLEWFPLLKKSRAEMLSYLKYKIYSSW